MFNKSPGPVAPCQSRAVACSSACRLEPTCEQSVLGLCPVLGARATQVAIPCPCQGHPAWFPGLGAAEEGPRQASWLPGARWVSFWLCTWLSDQTTEVRVHAPGAPNPSLPPHRCPEGFWRGGPRPRGGRGTPGTSPLPTELRTTWFTFVKIALTRVVRLLASA